MATRQVITTFIPKQFISRSMLSKPSWLLRKSAFPFVVVKFALCGTVSLPARKLVSTAVIASWQWWCVGRWLSPFTRRDDCKALPREGDCIMSPGGGVIVMSEFNETFRHSFSIAKFRFLEIVMLTGFFGFLGSQPPPLYSPR